MTASADERVVTLTPMQRRVLDELCTDGASNEDIAARLYVTPDTIKTHLRHILAATGAANRTALVVAVLTGTVCIARPVAAPPGDAGSTGIVHMAPRGWPAMQATGCCQRITDELPARDRLTATAARVTCPGRA